MMKSIETNFIIKKDQLLFNDELVSDQKLESMKSIIDENTIQNDSIKTDNYSQII